MKSKNTNIYDLNTKQVFWVLFSVVIAIVPHLPRLPVWFPLLLFIVVVFRWLISLKKINPIPNFVIAFITILIFLAIIYFQGLTLNREISVTILTTMTVLKLLETWQKRDAWMVVMLCYFVILTRFFYSQDLLLMFYLLSSVLVITHTLFVLQHSQKESFFVKKEIKQTLGLLAAGIPLAALFFLFFPRLGSPIWGSPDLFGEGATGISEEMSPGSISQLFNDDSTAFRVTFNTPIPKKSLLYWRGPVMWDFDGMTWTRNNKQQATSRHYEFAKEGNFASYEIELEPTGQHYLFPLDYVFEASQESVLLPDSELLSKHKLNQLGHFKYTSIIKTYNPYELLSNEMLDRLTTLPKGYNPKTLEMIHKWQQQQPDQEKLVRKILNWFATDEFYYSYSPPLLLGDTVDQFLFETKSGFCEHYASAFTVMMRAAGIPARIVTGYQGGILNQDYWLIKQSDAHAWSEVWIKNKGWLRVDPTAAVSPLRVEYGSQALMTQKSRNWLDSSWYRKMGERYDAVRHKWNKWVRDYNVIKQKALFEVFGFDSQDGKSIAIVLGLIMIVTTILVLLFLYLTRPKRKLNHYDKIYHKFIKITSKNKDIIYDNQGILNYAKVVKSNHPEAKNKIDEFTQLYLSLRYSNKKSKTNNLDQRLETLVVQIKTHLKSGN